MTVTDVPSRWTPLKHHKVQHALWHSKKRFCVVPAGRRSGKTELLKRKIVMEALNHTKYADAWYVCAAPTHNQAKRIFWKDLKALVPHWARAGKPSESELTIYLRSGTMISVLGLDEPRRIEGSAICGIGMDEIDDYKKGTWPENVRPTLSDRDGWAWIVGVPGGRGEYYRMAGQGKSDDFPDWGYYHWNSSDILPSSEIEAAKRDLDEATFRNQYEGSFLDFQGQAYYPFERHANAVVGLPYDPKAPLIFAFDFNVAPGVASIIQEQELDGVSVTAILSEVWIPLNSNTPAVCRKLIQDWGKHLGLVYCYGDATGGARGTAQVYGSDWDLIEAELEPHFKDRLRMRNERSNPAERARVNAVNSRIKTADGKVHLIVDSKKAPQTVLDFEGVALLEGGSGEIDKKKDDQRTHITDAIGYYIHDKFKVGKGAEILERSSVSQLA